MLDMKVERLRQASRKQVIHSVIIVSRLSLDLVDKRDIGGHYEKLFKSCHSKYQGDGPTGIILIYPQHCVHLLEAPFELINAVIIDLKELEITGEFLQVSRLLNFSTGLENRFYPQWCYRVLNISSLQKGDVYQTNDPIEQTVSSNIERLYQLGAHLSKQHQREMKRTLDALPDEVPQFLLQQDVLEYLATHPNLNTPEEFLMRYCTPHHVLLDSETVWPLPVRLFPYD